MKQFTSRFPCLTFTHSRWRGDFSSRALAHSWAWRPTAASVVATKSKMHRFIGFAVVRVGGSVPFSQAHFDTQVSSNLLFEGVQVWIRQIHVPVVVGVNDLRTELAHGATRLVR